MATGEISQQAAATLNRVWQPLQLGPTWLKNRIVVPARVLNYGVAGVISDRHLATYRELAEGGPALIITEQHAAHPVSKGSFHMPCTAWEYKAIAQFERFAAIVDDNDCRGVVQLFGAGVHDKGTMMMDEWHALWGVSRIPSFIHGESPLVMEKQHIAELVEGFGRSAQNVRAGGLHGVEIHAAHAYLLGQFLSPAYNTRTDEYGGSNQNRCRIVIEAANEVRERVGSDLAVGVRLTYDEFLGPAGLQPADSEEQIEILASSGLFDYFSISGGGYHTLHYAVAPMGSVDEGFMVPFAKRAKELIGDRAAVFTVGRIRDLHRAEDALASGSADAVAMGRAQLADPHLVRKTREGREHELVRCVGLNECIGRLFDQREVVCAMNPATGRERQWGSGTLRKTLRTKDVLVVGGGPAGMKTAAVAASRGHRVRLWEREDQPGGHLRLWSKLPHRGEWSIAIDNLTRAVENAYVDVSLRTNVSGDEVRDSGADEVILATGAKEDVSGLSPFRPDRLATPGMGEGNVVDIETAVERVLEDPASLGRKVLILDESGTYIPLAVAELLATNGVSVEIVSPKFFIGEYANRHLDLLHILPRLRSAGVTMTAQHGVERVDGSTVTIFDLWGGASRIEEGVDNVVASMYKMPDDELYKSLAENDVAVRRVGDCLAPRALPAILYDGEKMGREI